MMSADHRDLVSVVTPTYHVQARHLPYALESVLGQSYAPLECVVVHDGSEEVLKVLETFNGDQRLKAYKESRRGYIPALNQGIALSRGEYLAFCDSDDLLGREHVRTLLEALKADPEVGLVFDNMRYLLDVIPEGTRNGRLLISETRARRLVAKGVTLQEVFEENLVSGPAFMVPRRVLNEVGVFDENAFLLNDLHLFYRIGAFFPIRFVDFVGVQKRVHSRNLTTIHRHYEYGVRCLENIRDRYPQVYRRIGKRVFNGKLGRKYYRLGLHYAWQGDRVQAAEMYRKAMATRKLSFRYHWAYFLSVLRS